MIYVRVLVARKHGSELTEPDRLENSGEEVRDGTKRKVAQAATPSHATPQHLPIQAEDGLGLCECSCERGWLGALQERCPFQSVFVLCLDRLKLKAPEESGFVVPGVLIVRTDHLRLLHVEAL